MDFINEVIIHIVVCVEEPVFVCSIFNDGWFNQMLKLKYNGKEKTVYQDKKNVNKNIFYKN